MGEKWMDAYAKWPPMNQLLFSCVVVAIALLFVFLAGMWTLQVLSYCTGAKEAPKGKAENGTVLPPLQGTRAAQFLAELAALRKAEQEAQYKVEQAEVADEMARQADLQAKFEALESLPALEKK